MDSKKHLQPKTLDEWMETEYKRRVWWVAYISNVSTSFFSGYPLLIQSEEIFVNLPSNDLIYSGDVSYSTASLEQINFKNDSKSKNNSDTFWIVA
ncbi:hypothetical protein AYI70_g4335 [Smittium culicis]|uniref:Xylanolytic transcriptional activator regulatory domain-containing protein n=1 Tax=Smittium culicis TaxID=133412 RepID=A0A1R1XZH6_9FUNG|nr:hypothetical protein AYI70_g4335 [Smittium culicis]